MKGLLTTSIGSLPKPDYLLHARGRYERKAISYEELLELEKQATREWIQAQEELGLDILVDGEMYRGDMVEYFAENMEGFTRSGLVRSYGNRYYRKPVAVKPVGRAKPITIQMFTYAQSLTKKPIKGMLTGPYTMVDWSFNEYYPTREAFVMDMARVVHQEAKDLEAAGARYIQIDEPAISVRPEELPLAIKAMKVVTDGLTAYTITHICYGDFESIYPDLLKLPVRQFALEMTNSNFDLLNLFKKSPFTKDLGMGVTDVHTHVIEAREQVKAGIRRGLGLIPPERLYINPDCGLKTRTAEESTAKLKVMVETVREVKREMGIS